MKGTILLASILLVSSLGCGEDVVAPAEQDVCDLTVPFGPDLWSQNSRIFFCGGGTVVVNRALTIRDGHGNGRKPRDGCARYGWEWTRYECDPCRCVAVESGKIMDGSEDAVMRCE